MDMLQERRAKEKDKGRNMKVWLPRVDSPEIDRNSCSQRLEAGTLTAGGATGGVVIGAAVGGVTGFLVGIFQYVFPSV